jgi:hypothetical protein
MEPASIVYLILFLVGLGFAIVSFILSGLGHLGTGHAVDTGGHDVGVGGHDIDTGGHNVDIGHHDLDAHAHDSSSGIHLSPVSPITIAMFITAFGGIGFIFQQLPGGSLFFSLPIALISGFAIAAGAFYVLYKIFSITQADSNYSRESVLDLEAEVITAIPADGVGEIAYTAKGSRYSAPAMSEERKAIPNHAVVRMTKVVGNIFHVREIPEEELRRLYDELEGLDDSKQKV